MSNVGARNGSLKPTTMTRTHQRRGRRPPAQGHWHVHVRRGQILNSTDCDGNLTIADDQNYLKGAGPELKGQGKGKGVDNGKSKGKASRAKAKQRQGREGG